MKRSSVIAAFAALAAVLLIFTACGKNNKDKNEVTNPTVIGDDGQVYEEITEISSEIVTEAVPVTDENGEAETVTVIQTVPVTKKGGEKVTNAKGEQETETQVVTEVVTEIKSEIVTEVITYTQPVTTTEKANDKDKDKDKDDKTEEAAADAAVENETYPVGQAVQVELNKDGQPKDSKIDKVFGQFSKNKQFYIKCTIVTTETMGIEAGVPQEVYMKDNKFAYRVKIGALDCKVISDGKNASIVFPSAKAYYPISGDQAEDFDMGSFDLWDAISNSGLDYVQTTEVKVNGNKYVCEEYSDGEGQTMKYYFQGNILKRMEIFDSGATEPTIIKISEYKATVSDSVFEVPKNYVKLSDEAFEKLMGSFES